VTGVGARHWSRGDVRQLVSICQQVCSVCVAVHFCVLRTPWQESDRGVLGRQSETHVTDVDFFLFLFAAP
jgi:hypothetical protein